MKDIEQRAQKLLDGIQMRKNQEMADKIFREPKKEWHEWKLMKEKKRSS